MDFTLLRLVLALSVVFAHYAEITGLSLGWVRGLSSTVAVQAFFVISGWIVTASYESSAGAGAFMVRRMARLYPLYAATVIAQAIGLVLLASPGAVSAAELWHYVGSNLVFANFLKPTAFDFLDGARVAAINPSLWTLKIEVLFYLSVPLWVLLTRRMGLWGLMAVFAASTAYWYVTSPVSAELAKQLPGQLRFFAIGALCGALAHRFRDALAQGRRALLLGAGVIGLVSAHAFDASYAAAALQPVFVAAFVVAAARLLPAAKTAPDLSFGVYLLHAPLMQFSHQSGWLAPSGSSFALVLAMTLALACLAYYVIEKPAIRAGRRLSQRLSAPGVPAHAATGIDAR